MSPTIPAQTQTLKRTWYPRSRIAWGLSRAHRWLLWKLNIPSRENTLRLSTECYVKRTHPQRVHVAIRKIALVEDDCLETDVRSASSDMDVNLSSWSTSRIFGWDSPNSRAISRKLLHGSRSTAAIMASSLAGVRTVRGRPTFTSAVDVTRRRCSNHRNTLASGWRRPGQRRAYSRATVPAWLLQTPRFKSMSQYSSCVFSMIIRSQLSPAVYCVSWVQLTTRFMYRRDK
jgi:hypothetical protein